MKAAAWACVGIAALGLSCGTLGGGSDTGRVRVTSDEEARIPASLMRYLEDAFPGETPVTSADYEPHVLFRVDVSWMLIADFDGNGKRDVCLLLKGNDARVSLVFVHRESEGYRHFTIEPEFDRIPVRTSLSFDGPGRVCVSTPDDPNPSYEDLTCPAIVEGGIGTCHEMVYYWKDGEYGSAYRGM